MKKHVVDTSKAWVPDGWTLEENRSLGKIDITNITLWQSEKQKTGWHNGNELNKEVKNPMTSAVLRYLLDNPELIPEEWKDKYVYFHGTILRSSFGDRYVLCLYWGGGGWGWSVRWLDNDWHDRNFSAVLASSALSTSETENSSDTRIESFVFELKDLIKKYEKNSD